MIFLPCCYSPARIDCGFVFVGLLHQVFLHNGLWKMKPEAPLMHLRMVLCIYA